MTASIFSLPQSKLELDFTVLTQAGGEEVDEFNLPNETDTMGNFDDWIELDTASQLEEGDATSSIQTIQVYSDLSDSERVSTCTGGHD